LRHSDATSPRSEPDAVAHVDYGAVRNVLAALRGRPVRLALMTAVGTTDRANEGHDWKRRAERLVRASGNAFTIVRPGWFDYNAPDQRRMVMRQGDLYSTADGARDKDDMPLEEEPRGVRDDLEAVRPR